MHGVPLLGWAAISILLGLAGCRNRGPATAAGQAAMDELRALNTAQEAFLKSKGHYACTLIELGTQAGLVDREMLTGRKGAYEFNIHCTQTAVKDAPPLYQIWASPQARAGASPDVFYCTDQTGVVRQSERWFEDCARARPVE